MGQFFVLRIHTYAALVSTSVYRFVVKNECIVVAFVAYVLEGEYLVYMILAFVVGTQYNKFQSDGIAKTLFVDNILQFVSVVGFCSTIERRRFL